VFLLFIDTSPPGKPETCLGSQRSLLSPMTGGIDTVTLLA
jgi:hypothetical protein